MPEPTDGSSALKTASVPCSEAITVKLHGLPTGPLPSPNGLCPRAVGSDQDQGSPSSLTVSQSGAA